VPQPTPMHAQAGPGETVYAFDLFADQKANVDNSGGGQKHAPLVHYFWMIVNKVHPPFPPIVCVPASMSCGSCRGMRVAESLSVWH
jgi:hypothetical protein